MDFFTYFCSMEERKYIVYIHKNKINGKVYVGITHYTNPEKRWSYGYRGNPYFQSAISKYGWNNFEHIILFKNINKELACREEQLLISRYKKKGICYNIANGGEGSEAMSEEIKEKLRKYKGPLTSQYGKKHSPERIKHQANIMQSIWQSLTEEEKENRLKGIRNYSFKSGSAHPNSGKPLSEVHKLKLIKSISKPVSCYNLFGEFVNSFNSITEASKFYQIDDGHIGQACDFKRKTAGGYMWRWDKDTSNIEPVNKIIVLIKDNKIEKQFISIQDAANYVGRHYTCVNNILKGKISSPYSGLDFKYKEDMV